MMLTFWHSFCLVHTKGENMNFHDRANIGLIDESKLIDVPKYKTFEAKLSILLKDEHLKALDSMVSNIMRNRARKKERITKNSVLRCLVEYIQILDIDFYEKGLRKIITDIKKRGAKIILCTPTVIGERVTFEDELEIKRDQELDAFAGVVRNLSSEFNTELLDLRTIFKNYIVENNQNNDYQDFLTDDGVHLNDAGNKLIAEKTALIGGNEEEVFRMKLDIDFHARNNQELLIIK